MTAPAATLDGHVINQPNCFRTGVNGSGADILTRGLILKQSTTEGEVDLATAGTDCIVGVVDDPMYDDQSQSYQVDGRALVLSGAAVAVGDSITANGASKGVAATQSAGSPQKILGTALTATTGANELFVCELRQLGQLYTSVSAVADRTALAAIAASARYNGLLVHVQDDDSNWKFVSASSVTVDGAGMIAIAPAAGTGRWIRTDHTFIAKLPIGFGNTDAQALLTVPAGFALKLAGFPSYDITTAFTGGTSSAIGLSTTQTGYDTKGDIIGGATGDVLAGLAAGVRAGTIGAELDNTGFHEILLVATKAIQFDRITSVFTAGAGFVNIPVHLLRVPA